MGLALARTLAAKDFEVIATSRSAASRSAGRMDGITVVESPADVCEGASVILLSVFDTAAVQSVVCGDGGILTSLADGAVVVDLGTTAIAETLHLADKVRQRGGMFVDAPVSGGTRGAREGSLTIMAGGSVDAVEKASAVLRCLGRLNHMGAVGAGQSTKAVNQLILGQTLIAVAEGLILARRLGLDAAAVREALLGGFAESRVLAEHGRRMVTDNFTPGGSIAVFHKDMAMVRDLVERMGLPLTGLLHAEQRFAASMEAGLADLDQSAIVKLYDGGADIQAGSTDAGPLYA